MAKTQAQIAFARWFHGGSAADAEAGQRLGHFPTSYTPRWGVWGDGVYMTSSQEEAATFGDVVLRVSPPVKRMLDLRKGGHRAMPSDVFDSLRPQAREAFLERWDAADVAGAVRAGVLADGFDGLIWTGDNFHLWAVVFDPKKVRVVYPVKMHENPTPREGGVVRSTDYDGTPYLYHWTPRRALGRVLKRGLAPGKGQGFGEGREELRTTSEGRVFFSTDPDYWREADHVLLRVPTDSVCCFYDGTTYEDENGNALDRLRDCFSTSAVPADLLEVVEPLKNPDTLQALRQTLDEVSALAATSDEDFGRCSTSAELVAKKHGGAVWGYSTDGDDGRITSGSGHDFAVIDGRYLVDWWAKEYEGEPLDIVDMRNPEHLDYMLSRYGDPSTWELVVDFSARQLQRRRRGRVLPSLAR